MAKEYGKLEDFTETDTCGAAVFNPVGDLIAITLSSEKALRTKHIIRNLTLKLARKEPESNLIRDIFYVSNIHNLLRKESHSLWTSDYVESGAWSNYNAVVAELSKRLHKWDYHETYFPGGDENFSQKELHKLASEYQACADCISHCAVQHFQNTGSLDQMACIICTDKLITNYDPHSFLKDVMGLEDYESTFSIK